MAGKVDLSRPPMCYWDVKTILNHLQRKIIVYSIMYYRMGESCLSDAQFDELSQQYLETVKNAPVSDCKETNYWYCMYDYDGSTGYDLPARLNFDDGVYLTRFAESVLYLWKRKGVEW